MIDLSLSVQVGRGGDGIETQTTAKTDPRTDLRMRGSCDHLKYGSASKILVVFAGHCADRCGYVSDALLIA